MVWSVQNSNVIASPTQYVTGEAIHWGLFCRPANGVTPRNDRAVEYASVHKFVADAEKASGIVPRHNIWSAVERWVRKHPTRVSVGVIAGGIAVWAMVRFCKIIAPGFRHQLNILPPSDDGTGKDTAIKTPLRFRLPARTLLEPQRDPLPEGLVPLQARPLPWRERVLELERRLSEIRDELDVSRLEAEKSSGLEKNGQRIPLNPKYYLQPHIDQLVKTLREYREALGEEEDDLLRGIIVPLEEIGEKLGHCNGLGRSRTLSFLASLRGLCRAFKAEIYGLLYRERVSGAGDARMERSIVTMKRVLRNLPPETRVP